MLVLTRRQGGDERAGYDVGEEWGGLVADQLTAGPAVVAGRCDVQDGLDVRVGRHAHDEGNLSSECGIFCGQEGRGGVSGLRCDPILCQARQVGHDHQVPGPREALGQVPHLGQLSSFPHGPVDQEYGRPRSLPRRPHDERGVPSDTRLREAWISASGFDGWREHRRVENGGDHRDGTRLRVHPRPVRDEQPDHYREQYEIEDAPEPSTGESFCRILSPQRLSRRRPSSLPVTMLRGPPPVYGTSYVLFSGWIPFSLTRVRLRRLGAHTTKKEELHGKPAAAGRVTARPGIYDRERGTYRYGRANGPEDSSLLLPQGRHPGLHKGSVRLQGPHGRIREGGYTGLRRLARLPRISPQVPREVQPQLPTPHRRGWPRFGGPRGATRGPEADETRHLPARPGRQDLQDLP